MAEPTANRLATGHKGVFWLRVSATGRSAHGSRPDLGVSAITPLARLATTLADSGLPGTHPVMGPVTVNVGTFAGGTKINLVPDAATMTLDIRMVPGVTSAEILAHLRKIGGAELHIEVIDDLAPVYSEPDGPFVRLVADALGAPGEQAEMREPLTYFTDAAILAGALRCSEVVLLGPGDPGAAHTTDERCEVSQILTAAAVYEQVFAGWEQGAALAG